MEQLDLHDWTFVPSRAASMASLCASRCTSPPPPVLEGEWHVDSMPVLGSHSGVGPVSASALLHGLIAADNEHYFYAPPISRYSTSRQLQATALRVELAVGGDSNVILKIHRQSSCSSLGGISAGRFSSSGSPKAPLSPSRSWLGSDESNPKILLAHSQTGSSITGSTTIITGPGTTPPSSDNKVRQQHPPVHLRGETKGSCLLLCKFLGISAQRQPFWLKLRLEYASKCMQCGCAADTG